MRRHELIEKNNESIRSVIEDLESDGWVVEPIPVEGRYKVTDPNGKYKGILTKAELIRLNNSRERG